MDQRAALHLLGITDADIEGIVQAPTLKLACERLTQMQAAARRMYHRIALDLHPDRTGGDEAKLRKLQEISEVYDHIMNLELNHVRPMSAVCYSGEGIGVRFSYAGGST